MLQPIPSVPDPVDPEQEAQLDRELQELRDKVQQVRADAAVHAPAAAASPGEVALAWCGHILSTKKTASSDSTLIALLAATVLVLPLVVHGICRQDAKACAHLTGPAAASGCRRPVRLQIACLTWSLRCVCVQAHLACRQLKQQLLHMDKDLSKAGALHDH